MKSPRFDNVVTCTDQLQELLGRPSELVIKKQLSELDQHMISFIERAPFALLGTVDREGRCDVSPRGDRPSVATVLDSRTLAVAERPGNRRIDSLRNIVETGRIGMLFMIPGMGEALRVNGRACVIRDEEVLASMTRDGRQPVVGIGVEVAECYLQCAKALIRSELWGPHADSSPAAARHFAEMLIDQTGTTEESVDSLAQQIEESYRDRLY